MATKVAEIIINLKTRALDKLFTYGVPAELSDKIALGDRVVVSFNNSYCDGLVWNLKSELPDFKVKELSYLLPKEYSLSSTQLHLIKLLRSKYLASYQEAFLTVLPSVQKLDKIIRYTIDEEFNSFTIGQVISEKDLLKHFTKNDIDKLVKNKTLSKNIAFELRVDKPMIEWVNKLFQSEEEALANIPKRAVKRQRIIKYLASVERVKYNDLTKATRATRQDIVLLEQQGFLSLNSEEFSFDAEKYALTERKKQHLPLNEQQMLVCKAFLESAKPRSALLHGVTGSGKTRVYIELAKKCLQQGEQVLLLLPEISLTPQLIERFSSQLDAKIGVIHSHVSPKEKVAIYKALKKGEIDVIIGARSALFCSFSQLGLIIIDEEHENAFQADNIPRYHAVDLALALAQKNGIDILLGSATPAAESYYLAERGELQYLELKEPIAKHGLAELELVDIRALDRTKNCLSIELHKAISAAFERGEQVILFHNRRGFAHYRQCHHCGYLELCENCSVPLTVHANGKYLRCHYCDFQRAAVTVCPACAQPLDDKGLGIDAVLNQLESLFSKQRFALVQAKDTRSKENFRQILNDFAAGTIDCLLGTQVLAKGLDFPNVTVVGVLLADQLLAMPDFRNAERAYQMLLQLAGRAGRSQKKGRVIIQTLQTEHPLFDTLFARDYKGFINEELTQRALASFPPFALHLRINISSEDARLAHEQARLIYEFYHYNYQKNQVDVSIYPPVEQYYFKLRNRYYYTIYLKTTNTAKALVYQTLSRGIINNKYKLIKPNCWVDINFER